MQVTRKMTNIKSRRLLGSKPYEIV